MTKPLDIIIVEKTGELKLLSVKDFKEEELYKKGGFKKADNFIKQTEWLVSYPNGTKYLIQVYAKTEGRANSENKYDFPPPIDTKLFYGSCAILAKTKNSGGVYEYTDLSLSLWENIYEKLFGGFEDLALTSTNDDDEEDELANIPKEKKTKDGYLKDGFVVDSSDVEEDHDSELEDSDENETEESNGKDCIGGVEDDLLLEDIGSELSEDSYDYEENI